MKAAEKVKAIEFWQKGPFHPLTCGIDSRHGNLGAIIDGLGVAVMVCKDRDCTYAQRMIPVQVLTYYRDCQKPTPSTPPERKP